MDSMDPAAAGQCDACDHHVSPADLLRIRLATLGVSIIIAFGICSVPVLLVFCFGERHGKLYLQTIISSPFS